ncbi:MAG: uncharacterized protein PWQ67_1204 [Clostridia bacterium]|jgi:hypothetical protein|nr:uncharacterized protein [Clostridia bacterium]MDN5322750.1 uncharacterized protein [Clostridia bacterium]
MLEKRAYLTLLFDFYGGLLTEKQKLIFDLYYQCDLSLGEIAEEQNVSRQAVYDIIKRSENTLEEYEKKLQLVSKFQANKDKLQKALKILDIIEKEKNSTCELDEIRDLINSVVEDNY